MSVPLFKSRGAIGSANAFMNNRKNQKLVYDLLEQKCKEFLRLNFSYEEVIKEFGKRGYLKTETDRMLVESILKKFRFEKRQGGHIIPNPVISPAAWKIVQENLKRQAELKSEYLKHARLS